MNKTNLINLVKPADGQKVLQRDFFRILLLENDIDSDGKAYDLALKNHDYIECFRVLKKAFIPYSILYDNLKHFGIYSKNDSELILLIKNLREKLEFMNYLRNKMSGHLDSDIIDKAIQWQPALFSQRAVDNKGILPISYWGLFEASINSYLDNSGKQQYFGHEIDINYPPDRKEFINFIDETCLLSLSYLDKLKNKILPSIELSQTQEDIFRKAIWAAETEFYVSKKKHK